MKDDEKKVIMIERMAVLQGLAEAYLIKTKGKTFAEEYPDVKDEYGILNDKQSELLHYYLKDAYSGFGLDLEKALSEKGESFDGKTLTPFEKHELLRLADQEIIVLGTLFKRKKRLFKK